ncbi:pyridine nucleotide-disulfide oxidoreductase [Paracoccus sp. SM22M-07]|nr:pyridine nucleotide-disulfide oxidoreductase [Paracoccus sp. SM22M-07]
MDSNRSEVVIIGAGFAGLEVAKQLGSAGIATTIIDRRNHHLFQPLLYQVATAALSATDVAVPIRRILRRHASVKVIYDEVFRIDAVAQRIDLCSGDTIGFRHLVLASGATHGYFGHDEWAQWAPGLKTIEDARHIRSQLLLTFEQAERTTDPAERQRLMTIAIIGGGPTGVELAGAIAELSRHTLLHDFRSIDPASTRVMLVEAGPRLLSGFSEEMSAYAVDRLTRLGVTVRHGEAVEDIGPDTITIAGTCQPVGVVIWAAGVTASPLARQIGATDAAGRIRVDPTLQVQGHPGIFAIGDVAACAGDDGRLLPGLAQVARQQGIHLGRALVAQINDSAPLPAFLYQGRGNTAIVGRHAAVFEQGRFKIKGWLAWLSWAIIHVYLLIGFQKRFLVSVQWLWRYMTYERGARLIAVDNAPSHRATQPMSDTHPAKADSS